MPRDPKTGKKYPYTPAGKARYKRDTKKGKKK